MFNTVESVDEDWDEKFLKEITTLETINAMNIIKEAGEEISEIEPHKKENLIKQAVLNLKPS